MKLDPNLEKFIEANLSDIKRGQLSRSITHAEDYLFTITNSIQANKELDNFVRIIRGISRQQYA